MAPDSAATVKFIGGADGRPWIVHCPRCGGCLGSASEEEIAERMRREHTRSHKTEDARNDG